MPPFCSFISRVFWALALSVAIVVSGCDRFTPKLDKLDNNATLLAFGDSLTYGTGAESNESYPAVLQTLIGRKVVAAGVPGEVSQEGLVRLPEVLDEIKPRFLILCHGGNDFLRKTGEAQAQANVRAMVKLARDRGIAVVLIATPPEFYAEIAREFKIPFDDGVMKKTLTDNTLKSDYIHPNAKGYAQIAAVIAALLKKSGAV